MGTYAYLGNVTIGGDSQEESASFVLPGTARKYGRILNNDKSISLVNTKNIFEYSFLKY